ncbi:hypothetical protein BO443_20515 [Burkholderia orbicola]
MNAQTRALVFHGRAPLQLGEPQIIARASGESWPTRCNATKRAAPPSAPDPAEPLPHHDRRAEKPYLDKGFSPDGARVSRFD